MPETSGADSTAQSTLLKGWLEPFDYNPRTRVVFGPGTIQQLGALVVECGGRNVLLVTDKGLRAVGHIDLALRILRDAKLNVTVFEDVHVNPSTHDVERGLAIASQNQIDLLIGLGGGSSLDTAKLVALRNAAKIGFDAIECGGSLVLETDQDIANLVRQAGERALKKRMVFLSKQLANASV